MCGLGRIKKIWMQPQLNIYITKVGPNKTQTRKFKHQSCDSGPAGLPTSKQKKTFLALDAFCVS